MLSSHYCQRLWVWRKLEYPEEAQPPCRCCPSLDLNQGPLRLKATGLTTESPWYWSWSWCCYWPRSLYCLPGTCNSTPGSDQCLLLTTLLSCSLAWWLPLALFLTYALLKLIHVALKGTTTWWISCSEVHTSLWGLRLLGYPLDPAPCLLQVRGFTCRVCDHNM